VPLLVGSRMRISCSRKPMTLMATNHFRSGIDLMHNSTSLQPLPAMNTTMRVLAGLILIASSSACATCKVVRAIRGGSEAIYGSPDSPGRSPIDDLLTPCVAPILIVPLALAFDVVAFPFQLALGCYPYGDEFGPQ
jgi:hypothetical protein